MYGQEQNSREKIIEQYSQDVERLLKYLPWLSRSSKDSVSSYYEGEGEAKETLLKFPVYDSTLLEFVKVAEKTQLVSKNYPFVYSKHRITSHEQERILLRSAKIQDMNLFIGIISKYVLEGKRRPAAWTEAVSEQIFVTALECLRELFFNNKVDNSSAN